MSNKPVVKNGESEMGVTASKEDLSYEQLFAETKIMIEDSEEAILEEIENQREEFATYEQLIEEEREDSSSIENEDKDILDDESYAQLLEGDMDYAALSPSENKAEEEDEKGKEELELGIDSTKAYSAEEEKGSKDEGDTQETDTSVESDGNEEAKKEIKSVSSMRLKQRVAELPLEDSITYEQIVEEGKVKRSPSIEAMLKRQKSKQTINYEDLAEETQGIASENAVLDVQSHDSVSYEELVGDFLGPTSRNKTSYEITNEKGAVESEAVNDKADPVVGSCGCGDCVIS